ncbi:MAG: hypothetical protein MIO90_06520 [Methanomassiliicoccales archaeon]|nr:hypothetical protein [Methanomassiliicoccales archaeon]
MYPVEKAASFCSHQEEMLEIGTMAALLTDPHELKGHQRRFNHGGRISIPALVRCNDGSQIETMCYLSFIGEGTGPRVIAMFYPNDGSSGN